MPLWPQVAQRRLVGARPKPVSSGQHGPKRLRRFAPYSHTINAPFHAFCPARCSPAESAFPPVPPGTSQYLPHAPQGISGCTSSPYTAQRLGGFWHTEPLRPFEGPSMILLEQIFTIDKSRMERFMGCAAKTEMLRIDMALLVSLALNVLTGNRGE